MAITLVGSASLSGSAGGNTFATPIDTTGATLLAISVSYYAGGGAVPTVSDSFLNTFVGLTARIQGNTGYRLFYCATPTVGAGHYISVNAGSLFYTFTTFLAFAGVSTTAPFEVENGATTAAAGPLATGSVTPTANGALILSGWAGMNATSNPTVGSGLTLAAWTNPVASTCIAGAIGSLVQTTAAAINPSWSWTGTDDVGAAVAVFKAPAAAAVERVETYVWLPS